MQTNVLQGSRRSLNKKSQNNNVPVTPMKLNLPAEYTAYVPTQDQDGVVNGYNMV